MMNEYEDTQGRRYFQHIDKDYMDSLPVRAFDGEILLIDTAEKLNSVKPDLLKHKFLGFDTETRPSFKKGRFNSVALLQLASQDKAYLLRLNRLGLPGFIADLLGDPQIIKVGVAIKDDLRLLNRIRSFDPQGFIELQEFVKNYDILDNGLKRLAANVLGIRISKKNQTSNWERSELTEDQMVYAATDAWVCLKIYNALLNA